MNVLHRIRPPSWHLCWRIAIASAMIIGCSPIDTSTPSLAADSGQTAPDAGLPTAAKPPQPVAVVLFTHIEDDAPAGAPGSPVARSNYVIWRDRLIKMAALAKGHSMTWVLQPDWKILVAAQQYEDAASMATTDGKNVFRYLHDSYGVVIDAHAHETGDYNYTDVAHLLTALGVGGTTVIGGHVWDPSLPQFAHWERFRVPVAGKHFPSAMWRGDILMGAGTPGHKNDPIVSGVWRPKEPKNFWVDDPAGNIASVGAFKNDIAGISTLIGAYGSGKVTPQCILTSTFHITPAMIQSTATLATLESDVFKPLEALRKDGVVEITDFTSLHLRWKLGGSIACLYQE